MALTPDLLPPLAAEPRAGERRQLLDRFRERLSLRLEEAAAIESATLRGASG